ncbi:hypothetical protein D3C83_133860 [compost metagenome]
MRSQVSMGGGMGLTMMPIRSIRSKTSLPGMRKSTRTKFAWLGATWRPIASSDAVTRARSLRFIST